MSGFISKGRGAIIAMVGMVLNNSDGILQPGAPYGDAQVQHMHMHTSITISPSP
jgi:hypothetical protein